MDQYVSKARTTKITAESSITIKLKDNFYKVTFGEEREIPDDADIERERTLLFDDVNSVVDAQANEILKTFR